MRTVNISLTAEQTNAIDQAIDKFGFANRSELFRALIRTFLRRPEVITEEDFPLKGPDTKSAKIVLNSFKATGKYSKAFLKDLEKGLKNSDYFMNDLAS